MKNNQPYAYMDDGSNNTSRNNNNDDGSNSNNIIPATNTRAGWAKIAKFRLSSLAPTSYDTAASDDSSGAGTSSRVSSGVDPELDSKLELLYLAHQGDVDGIARLLARGVDVNFADFDNRTALHVAACEGNAQVVRLLLQKGAYVNAQDRWGSTALADAFYYQNEDVCKVLSDHGGKIFEARHEASMRVENPFQVPEYEVNLTELDFSHSIQVNKKGYQVATWRGIKVFVKCLKDNLVYGEKELVAFRSELSLIQKLRHPNIVQFLGAVTQCTPYMMIFEYLPKGDLYTFLKNHGALKPLKAIEFALDIARGLNYMHEHKPEAIIHRDLKPKNILRDEAGHLKVADLGLSKVLKFASQTVQEDGTFPLKGSSCRYLAPEVYKNKAYGRKVDVFAFGLILQEMIEGCQPFRDLENKEVPDAYANKNIRPPFRALSRCYPGDLKRLIEDCWHTDPEARPTFKEIIERLERIKSKHSESSLKKFLNLLSHR